jgi:RNA polymerase sigma-70 factor (ECF subfamily)
MLDGVQRRARPMDLTSPGAGDGPLGNVLPEATWILPIPDGRVLPANGDPADLSVARESIRLAFVAALQYLPPRQRAVLILCEVLDWKASEVAELLETSVASVNSALQRARASLATRNVTAVDPSQALDQRQQDLLARYVAAFEQYDMDALTTVLHDDATWSMPPFPLWLRGHRDIRLFCLGIGSACRGSILVPTVANGSPAFGQYKPDGQGGYQPWALQVLELAGDRIAGVTFFLDTARLFPLFGLPSRLAR